MKLVLLTCAGLLSTAGDAANAQSAQDLLVHYKCYI